MAHAAAVLVSTLGGKKSRTGEAFTTDDFMLSRHPRARLRRPARQEGPIDIGADAMVEFIAALNFAYGGEDLRPNRTHEAVATDSEEVTAGG